MVLRQPGAPPTIDGDDRARDERGAVRSQEGTDLGDLASEINAMKRRRQEQVWRSNSWGSSRRDVRDAKRQIKSFDGHLEVLAVRFETMAAPQRERLSLVLSSLEAKEIDLKNRTQDRTAWQRAHPEVARRLTHLDIELGRVERALTVDRNRLDGIEPTPAERDRDRIVERLDQLSVSRRTPQRGIDGPDLGIGL